MSEANILVSDEQKAEVRAALDFNLPMCGIVFVGVYNSADGTPQSGSVYGGSRELFIAGLAHQMTIDAKLKTDIQFALAAVRMSETRSKPQS